jgi:hypothetical protein
MAADEPTEAHLGAVFNELVDLIGETKQALRTRPRRNDVESSMASRASSPNKPAPWTTPNCGSGRVHHP